MKKIYLIFTIGALAFSSCKKEEKKEVEPYLSGFFISNEGSSEGSISHFASNKVTNDIYADANEGVPAGTYVQSVAISGNNAFIVSNGGGEVHIAEASTFEWKKSLKASYPRYVNFGGNYAYLTNGNYAGKLYKIDLTTLNYVDSVAVGNGPENVTVSNGKIYVANSGGWDIDSTVTIINASTFAVEKTVNVGYKPNDFVVDNNGDVWVSVSGLSSWDANGPTAPYLVQIDGTNGDVLQSVKVGLDDQSVSRIAISKDKSQIYFYLSNGLYSFDVANGTISSTPVVTGSFYGVEVNPSSGNVYVFDAKGFAGNGEMKEYNSSLEYKATYQLGVGPNGGWFK